MPDTLTDKLRAIGKSFRAAEQHQHADAIDEAVARMETQAIADNLTDLNADASDNGIEWGEYTERNDGDDWTPLIYSADDDRELAEAWVKPSGSGFRNQRLVCRTVGEWKVVADRA